MKSPLSHGKALAFILVASVVLLTALSCEPYGGLASNASPSPTATPAPTPTAPAAPSGLAVSLATKSALYLDWADTAGAASYTVYRSASLEGPYELLGTATESSYHDAGLSSETGYYYQVSASNEVGDSPRSASLEGATNPASNVSVEFACPSSWSIGNPQTGYFPVTRLFISGNINAWPNVSPVEFVKDEEGIFRVTLDFPAGTSILFKYQAVSTSGPNHLWLSNMEAFFAMFADDPEVLAVLSPDPADLTYPDDGFQGKNASFVVPAP